MVEYRGQVVRSRLGMFITRRQLVVSLVAGAAGAAPGASHILCPSGECSLTGSWYGTGALFAMLGFLYAEGCPACQIANRCTLPGEPEETSDPSESFEEDTDESVES
jgi:hypothetical protein